MISLTDTDILTDDQQAVLDAVRNRPGMTLDFYATSIVVRGETVDIVINHFWAEDLGFLVFNGFINRDPRTGALTVKG